MSTKAKVTLGKTPKSFPAIAVEFTLPDGSEGVINAVFAYKTRTQYGQFLDRAVNKDKEGQEAAKTSEESQEMSWEKIFSQGAEKNAEFILEILQEWDVDGFKIDRASILQMSDEMPAAPNALLRAYREACTEGVLGNLK
jgi:hypothetical protein